MNSNIESDRLNMVCIYAGSLNDWHGAAAGLKNMLHTFKTLGIKTDLISYSYHSNKFHIEQRKIDTLLDSTTIHIPSHLPNFLKGFSIFWAFAYAWKPAKKCDVIFADAGILSAVSAIGLSKLFGKPVIIHYTDQILHHLPESVYKSIIKNSDTIFAISPYLIGKAREYGCKNVVYLPAFVDVDLFNMDLTSRNKIRGDMGIKDDDIVIGYTGSFWYIEGVSNLLQAFKILLDSYPNIRLIIVGGKKGKNEDDIPTLVKDLDLEDNVIMVPPQPHDEVPKFLSACDVTCCPKIDCEVNRAANPIKVVEYLSMGLPTVCSAVGGITDTIEDGVDGLLVKPGDVKELEEKLEWILLNPEHAKEIGESGRKTAIEKYSYEAIENTIGGAVSEIVDMKKGNRRKLE